MPSITWLLQHPAEFIAGFFSLPMFSLVFAALITAVVLVLRRLGAPMATPTTDPKVTARYRPEQRTLAIGALGVIVLYAVENIVRGYFMNLVNVVAWWQYATAIAAAAVCLGIVLAQMMLRPSRPEQPVTSSVRRTWASFGPRADIIGAAASFVAIMTTTIAAGTQSSADDDGRFIHLALPVPNTEIEPLRPWFYGWDFGVPVLVATAVLATATWLVLRTNAARPFLKPGTVAAESIARRDVATATTRLATASTLLALGGAWRFIARSGGLSSLQIEGRPETFDVTWRYAEFAAVAGWLAPVTEIAAFILLLLVASRLHRGVTRTAPEPRRAPTPESTVVQ